MAGIKVFSRSPIGHLFTIAEGGEELKINIKGMNSHQIIKDNNGRSLGGRTDPFMNEIDELVFAKILDKYKNHVKLFGGTINGVKYDPLIFVAKTIVDATKKSEDSKPIIKDIRDIMVSKTQGITTFKNDEQVAI